MSPPARRRTVRARAKVNLGLAVVGRRRDGFHALESVFLRLALADTLSGGPVAGAVPADDPALDRLAVEGTPECPVADNLVVQATRVLRLAAGRPLPPLALRIVKRIPLASGLGGGSSDSAAALALAADAWGLDLTPAQRLALAAELGSDVPFFAADVPAAFVEGRGETVRALPAPGGRPGLLLVTARPGLVTRDVFAAFAAGPPAGDGAREATRELAARLGAGLSAGELAVAAADLASANDLWPAVARLRPDLAALRADLEAWLGRPVLLSGSGPTLVALYASGAEAEAAAAELRAAAPASARGAVIIATGAA